MKFKINLLAPADGELMRAVGRVVKSGRTPTVTEAEVFVLKDEAEKACARMAQTLICLAGRPDMPQPG